MKFLTLLTVLVVFLAIVDAAEEQNSVATEGLIELVEAGSQQDRVVRRDGRHSKDSVSQESYRSRHDHHHGTGRSGPLIHANKGRRMSGRSMPGRAAPTKHTPSLTATHSPHNKTVEAETISISSLVPWVPNPENAGPRPEDPNTEAPTLLCIDCTESQGDHTHGHLSVSNKISAAEEARLDKEFEAYIPTNQELHKSVAEIDEENEKIMSRYAGGIF